MNNRILHALNRATVLVLSLLASILGGCAHLDPEDPDAPGLSLRNPASSGAAQARRDLKAGHLQLMEAGTIGVSPPAEAPNEARFANIPRHRLPSGTDKNAAAWAKYAEGYNAVMIAEFDKETTH